MLTSRIVRAARESMLIAIFVLAIVVQGDAEDVLIEPRKIHVDPRYTIGTSDRQHSGRQIFDFRKNGIRVDIRVVPSYKNESSRKDDFPDFPSSDISRCIVDLSLICAKNRLRRFVDSIRNLNEIYLIGRDVKLVKSRVVSNRRSINESNDNIERSVNDFFDAFALRITLPTWNGKREKNQIDVMLDETAVVEGRGKGGGGGSKGGKGGGKCKMMMMAGLMMLKMKLMGVATMKGMMMAGMSLMISMAMLMHKYMKGGGGGGYNGGNSGQYKEIVLLTKSSGGGGGGGGGGYGGGGGGGGYGGGGGCCSTADTYGAPPSSSYGPPSGSGGGWGRSFGKRFLNTNYDGANDTTDSTNSSLRVEQPMLDTASRVNYRSYSYPPLNSRFAYSNGNFSDYGKSQIYSLPRAKVEGSMKNDSRVKSLSESRSSDYTVKSNTYQNEGSTVYAVDSKPVHSYAGNVNHLSPTKYIGNKYDTNVQHPVYIDEWQPTESKILSPNLKRDIRERMDA